MGNYDDDPDIGEEFSETAVIDNMHLIGHIVKAFYLSDDHEGLPYGLTMLQLAEYLLNPPTERSQAPDIQRLEKALRAYSAKPPEN